MYGGSSAKADSAGIIAYCLSDDTPTLSLIQAEGLSKARPLVPKSGQS